MKPLAWLTLATSLALALPACSEPAPPPAPAPAPAVTKSQVLLRNYMTFTGGQKSQGASAFLLKQGDATYAVTAKHMLGEDMGIEPAVPPSHVNAELKGWLFYIPGTTNIVAWVDHLVTPNDDLTVDRIAFAIGNPAVATQAGVTTLSLAPSLPEPGATLFIMGCLYAEPDCHQTVYRLTYIRNDGGELVAKPIDPIAEFAGFSGAPVVDAQGRAVALGRGSYSGGPDAGNVILYTLIGLDKDIQP